MKPYLKHTLHIAISKNILKHNSSLFFVDNINNINIYKGYMSDITVL